MRKRSCQTISYSHRFVTGGPQEAMRFRMELAVRLIDKAQTCHNGIQIEGP